MDMMNKYLIIFAIVIIISDLGQFNEYIVPKQAGSKLSQKDNVYDLESLVLKLQSELGGLQRQMPAIQKALGNCGDQWISYSDTKCFRVLYTKATEVAAKQICSQLDSTSTLITIGSADEQKFIDGILRDFTAKDNDVWLGLESVNNVWKWMDGNDYNYTNWDENAIKDPNTKCVQMSIVGNNVGKWVYDLCEKKYLVACQKMQTSRTVMEQKIDKLTKRVNELEHSTIPIGFLYTQLPNQSLPSELWPSLQWLDVTQQYSGLFFRAEGSGSEVFGQIQQANQSWISHIHEESAKPNAWAQGSVYTSKELKTNDWTRFYPREDNNDKDWPVFYRFDFFTTGGEVRPRNTAVKIWKRVK